MPLAINAPPSGVLVTRLQNYARAGHLAKAMAGFIQWLAPRIDDLKKTFPVKVRDLRDANIKEFAGAHTRAPELFGNLYAAADLLIEYLEHIELINSIRAVDLMETIEQQLKAAMRLQGQYQRQTDEVERFVALLRGCFSTGEVHVKNHLDQGPPDEKEFAFGWRESIEEVVIPMTDKTVPAKREDEEQQKQIIKTLAPRGCPIGWINEMKGEIWLEPEPTFKAIQRFASSQNEPMIMHQSTLWKRLFERGLLLASEPNSKTGEIRPTPKRAVAGRKARVLVMSADLITGCDDDWQAEEEFKNRFKPDQ